MQETEKEKQSYQSLVKSVSPKSKTVSNCFRAFWVGGAICSIGQFITNCLSNLGYTFDQTAMATTVILIFLAAFLTGLGLYERLGKYAGAGSIVPITGFANSMVAPAMEFKNEGYVMGVGAKLFTIAGPVVVYGTAASVVVGLVYSLIK